MVLTGQHIDFTPRFDESKFAIDFLTLGYKAVRFITYLFGIIGRTFSLVLIIPLYYIFMHPIVYFLFRSSWIGHEKLSKVFIDILKNKDKVKDLTENDKAAIYNQFRKSVEFGNILRNVVEKQSKVSFFEKPIHNLFKKTLIAVDIFEKEVSPFLFIQTPSIIEEAGSVCNMNKFEDFAEDWNEPSMDIYDIKYGPLSQVN